MKRSIFAIFCALCLLVTSFACAETPPAKPEGDAAAPQGQPGGTPPDGQSAPPDGMGAPPDGQQPGTPPDGQPGGSVSQGTSATTLLEDTSISGGDFLSTNADENALRAAGLITVKLENITLEKSGDTSSADSSNFYGQNAAFLATDSATVSLTGVTAHTGASGANGVFSYGSGTTVSLADSTVTTEGDNSGGVMVSGGGTMTVTNTTIETQGASAAALRTDRGGGTLTVDGGSYTTHGTGSPAVYSTAAISVAHATLAATASEAIVVEGKNSVELTDCDVTGNMTGTYQDDSAENLHNVMLYQSMSGDADVGQSHFTMTGGALTSHSGDLFYVTNTSCAIALSGVTLVYANDTLLTVAGNDGSRGWGNVGANGGQCEFTADAQTLAGTITVDSISTLALTLQNGSAFTGTVNPGGQDGEVNVVLDSTSQWTLTADAYVTTFTGSMDNVVTNGFTLNVANEA
ncbi:MAG: hypothetical protein PHY12_06125 [Eubacteriales bacterium]|nr:hypothetical protein [Eubacteriales bacterium]